MIILDLEIPFVGKNQKYIKSKFTGNFILSPAYRKFKEDIFLATKKIKTKCPFLIIELYCYHDIDAIIQPILDSVQTKLKQNDRNIKLLVVAKTPVPKGQTGRLIINALEHSHKSWNDIVFFLYKFYNEVKS